MDQQKHSRSNFKYLFIGVCLIAAAIISYDIKVKGNWKNSNTKHFLKELGVCEYSHLLYNRVQSGLLLMDQKIESNFPTYHRAVVEISTPYVELGRKLGLVFCNMFNNFKEDVLEKYPLQSVEEYASGVVKQSQRVINNLYSSSVFYFGKCTKYLQEEVFIGQLSPENMQRVVVEAFNTTQNLATECYHWMYEKVQNAIK